MFASDGGAIGTLSPARRAQYTMDALNNAGSAALSAITPNLSEVDASLNQAKYDSLSWINNAANDVTNPEWWQNFFGSLDWEAAGQQAWNGISDWFSNLFSDSGSGSGSSDSGSTSDDLVSSWKSVIDDFFKKYNSSTEAANILARKNANSANQFSHDEAQLARDWYEYMENTYYQRRKKDMVAAGFNPWMALYSSGNTGASVSSSSGQKAETFRSRESISDYLELIPLVLQLAQDLFSHLSSAKHSPLSLLKIF